MKDILRIIEKYAYNKELVRNANLKSKIIADLKINSTRIVDIILDIEDEYNITIEDESLEKLVTIEDVLNIISQNKKQS
ncbi:MAG: phosphopantetheine-binding protein [Bacteroidales bacterium]|nr:phosphopantetheine-binding protein [Bacteroidales bacterium]MDY0140894.1 phosphopantetheine-binding protein [Bacteroidales bacterium]